MPATKLYLRDLSNALSGTFPTNARESGAGSWGSPAWSVLGAATLKQMRGTKGSAFLSSSGSSVAQTSGQNGFFSSWCSDTLDVNQTVGGGTITINIAVTESNTNMNLGDGASSGYFAAHVYVWRPGSGTLVGYVTTGTESFSTTEPSAASTKKAIQGTMSSTAISALAGDVVIVELWVVHAQGMATSYTGSIDLNGTVETTVTNTTVTDHAAFIQFTETLTFGTPPTGVALKTVNGLANASVKTFNGLAIASVKAIDGLSTS